MVDSNLCWQCSNETRKCREHINTLGRKDKLTFLKHILEQWCYLHLFCSYFHLSFIAAVQEEVLVVKGLMGQKKETVIVADGPLQSNHKICLIRRPSSQVDILGDVRRGIFQPGLLHLLRLIVLDRFVACVRRGRPFGAFKKCMLFFRSAQDMAEINSWLMKETGYKLNSDAPFVMSHASLPSCDEAVIQHRRSDILLFLTTSRLLLGVNIPGVNLIIMVRPPSQQHALIQACGRAGRLLPTGQRETSMIMVLYNAQDLGVKGMSPAVRDLCNNTTSCLREQLRSDFVGEYASCNTSSGLSWCCNNCDKSSNIVN